MRFETPLPLRHFQQWLYQVGGSRPAEAARDPVSPPPQLRAV